MVKLEKCRWLKVRSSSMVEVLVAMVLFTVVFTIGITVYVNVVRSGFSMSKLKATLLLNKIAMDTKINRRFIPESIQEGTISIDKQIEDYNKDSQLVVIVLKAYDANHMLLAERKELWAMENE
ncbi:MAG: hypothetical protein JWO58_3111 [Chitinophagaceae bacterium]|nr:hypothetical protein [Chitinophagaceae bacterium]